ncbi:MAG: hypothetical protein HY023_14185 [Chloroflexi bacterium]|nr:hypothetical protein [Chloroflexota bacterium]
MTKSRVAVLGTLADLHQQSIAYDLKVLARLVKQIQPDLLCAEIGRDHWETSDLARMPVEYREALVPVCKRSDIVLIPVAGSEATPLVVQRSGRWRGLRAALVGLLNWHLRVVQRLASTPEAINSGTFGTICSSMCGLIAWAGGPEALRAWATANDRILQNVLAAVRRDPGRRVLVTVDCRRRHLLDRRLRTFGEIEVVEFHQL